jgi:hypothetical protein
MPFEWIWPNHGRWDDLPAAHAAAITFDLITTWGMYVLGTRLRQGQAGRTLGTVLAFAWVAFPYSTFVLESNSNDTLTAAFVVWALVFMHSPVTRGALVALGGAAKFAPWVLAPLLGSGRGERRGVQWFLFLVGFATVVALAILPFTDDVGVRKFWDATAGYQADRPSPFSIWGLYDGITPLRRSRGGATRSRSVHWRRRSCSESSWSPRTGSTSTSSGSRRRCSRRSWPSTAAATGECRLRGRSRQPR